MIVGLGILSFVVLLGLIGPLFVDPRAAHVGAVIPKLPPSAGHLLGTDAQGRDMLTLMVLGTPQTLKMGLFAGIVGIGIGLVLGLLAGYFGGLVDRTINIISDTLMTVPGLAVLVIIAANVDRMTVEIMSLVVAALAWMYPTRMIRAQVLSIRERPYIEVARVNGESELEILFREVLPNLLPFIAASFVGAVSAAMLAAVGLEALGLGALEQDTLGTTIYWAQQSAAVLRGFWWWWGPPIVMIGLIFVALFLTSLGIDRIANPKTAQS
ncbi:MAG: ABC transporter permease [Solirubrobacterales bacterium]|nr:ABC transporter permease [Solirubrobacterales bacterium]